MGVRGMGAGVGKSTDYMGPGEDPRDHTGLTLMIHSLGLSR